MGDVRIIDHSDEVISALNTQLEAALEAVGLFVAAEAQDELENTPRRVDTGNLKNSMSHQTDSADKCVYVGTNVEYGIYVHEGTSNMQPNRFLKNAVERNIDQIQDYFKKNLKS